MGRPENYVLPSVRRPRVLDLLIGCRPPLTQPRHLALRLHHGVSLDWSVRVNPSPLKLQVRISILHIYT
jgi:hypothetical protein